MLVIMSYTEWSSGEIWLDDGTVVQPEDEPEPDAPRDES